MHKKAKVPAAIAAVLVLLFSLVSGAVGVTSSRHIAQSTCAPMPVSAGHSIAVMGDSISTSWNATPGKSWPELLRDQAGTHGWAVSLHGIGATRAEEYLPGANLFFVTEAVRDAKPNVVTLNWRTNEQLQGRTPEQLKTALVGVMTAIRAGSPSTQFMMINPPLMWYHDFQGATTQYPFIAAMWEAADQFGACKVDMVPFFPKHGPTEQSRLVLGDDIHPSDRGHEIFYTAVYSAMRKVCV